MNKTAYDMDWLERSRKVAYSNDPKTGEARSRATTAFLTKCHRLWHTYRGIEPCAELACEHPWAP